MPKLADLLAHHHLISQRHLFRLRDVGLTLCLGGVSHLSLVCGLYGDLSDLQLVLTILRSLGLEIPSSETRIFYYSAFFVFLFIIASKFWSLNVLDNNLVRFTSFFIFLCALTVLVFGVILGNDEVWWLVPFMLCDFFIRTCFGFVPFS